MNDNRNALWDILERYSESGLFRDWNHPAVNGKLRLFAADIEAWARGAEWDK